MVLLLPLVHPSLTGSSMLLSPLPLHLLTINYSYLLDITNHTIATLCPILMTMVIMLVDRRVSQILGVPLSTYKFFLFFLQIIPRSRMNKYRLPTLHPTSPWLIPIRHINLKPNDNPLILMCLPLSLILPCLNLSVAMPHITIQTRTLLHRSNILNRWLETADTPLEVTVTVETGMVTTNSLLYKNMSFRHLLVQALRRTYLMAGSTSIHFQLLIRM